MSKIITKKVLSRYYQQIVAGQKTYEVRLADWDCQPGDTLELVETTDDTRQPTGRTLRKKVGTVVRTKDLDFWMPEEVARHGYQVISLLPEENA